MHRVNLLRHYGVKPVLVFDGGLLPMKLEQENKRGRYAGISFYFNSTCNPYLFWSLYLSDQYEVKLFNKLMKPRDQYEVIHILFGLYLSDHSHFSYFGVGCMNPLCHLFFH